MELTLNADVREKSTKGKLSQFRKERLIPGVVYGGKKPPVNVVVTEKELLKLTKAGGANAIIHLKTEKGEDTVILKAMQRHVVTNQPLHADFQRISMTTKIEVKVPLHVAGEAPGVKTGGGILEHVLRELRVRALPAKIPQRIDVDVSRLELNQKIEVKDLVIPEGVEVLDAPEHIVVNVVQPTAEEEAPAPAEGAAAAGTEPEVIAKGKKEEEGAEAGKEGAKPAAGGAKAEAKPEGKKEGK